MIKQLFDSVAFWIVVLIGVMFVMMWFNVSPTDPDKAVRYCLGVDVPQKINAAQSERFCYCIKNVAQGSDEQKTKACLNEQHHAQKVRLTNQETK